MKVGFFLSLMLMVVSLIAVAAVAADDFDDIPCVSSSLDVSRESYESKVIEAPYSPFFQRILDELYHGRGRDIFDVRNGEVSWDFSPIERTTFSVAKIKCFPDFECAIVSTSFGAFLITFEKDYKRMIDYSMLTAYESYYDKERGRSVRKKVFIACSVTWIRGEVTKFWLISMRLEYFALV